MFPTTGTTALSGSDTHSDSPDCYRENQPHLDCSVGSSVAGACMQMVLIRWPCAQRTDARG